MNPELYKSAQDGNLDNLKQQLDVLVGSNEQIPDQLTRTNSNLLHVLSQFGDFVECVLEILDRIHNLEDEHSMLTGQNLLGETALHVASRNGRVKIVQTLIERAQSLDREYLESGAQTMKKMTRSTDQHGDTVLHNAVKFKHGEIVQLLVTSDPQFEHPTNKIDETPLYVAVERDYNEIVDLIITNCSSPGYKGPGGKTALHAAVLDSCIECTRKLLEKNPTLTKQADELGRIPLHYAAYGFEGSSELARVLLNADKYMVYVPINKYDNKTALHITACTNDYWTDDNKTALHVAACTGDRRTMEELLEHCPDCWDMVTSKSQNILHLAAICGSHCVVDYILEQRWAINLVNQKDGNGNTPLHLLAKHYPWMIQVDIFKNEPLLDPNAANKEGFTPIDLLLKQEIPNDFEDQFQEELSKLNAKRGRRNFIDELDNKRNENYKANHDKEDDKKRRESQNKFLEVLGRFGETQLIVATLIATVTFAAGFTLPGGYDGNNGPNQGMAVLIKKAAFKTFVVSDVVAVTSSLLSVFLHFAAAFRRWEKGYEENEDELQDELVKLYIFAMVFLLIAKIGMVIALITGLYTVLDEGSLSLAISVCCLGCFALLFIFYKFHQAVGLPILLKFASYGLLRGW